MVEPADREFLRSIFLMEAWETVAALEDGADAAARGDLEPLYVVTHRLKGAASLHGFPSIAALASELESAVGATPFDAGRMSTLLAELKRALDSLPPSDPPLPAPSPEVAVPAIEPTVPAPRTPAAGTETVLDDP